MTRPRHSAAHWPRSTQRRIARPPPNARRARGRAQESAPHNTVPEPRTAPSPGEPASPGGSPLQGRRRGPRDRGSGGTVALFFGGETAATSQDALPGECPGAACRGAKGRRDGTRCTVPPAGRPLCESLFRRASAVRVPGEDPPAGRVSYRQHQPSTTRRRGSSHALRAVNESTSRRRADYGRTGRNPSPSRSRCCRGPYTLVSRNAVTCMS